VTHGEFEALVEALIEEARQRQRRRRRRNAAFVTLAALAGVTVFALLGRSAQSQTAAPALSARSSVPAAATSSQIAFINEGSGGGYCGTVWVMNPDGSGQHRLTNGGVPGCGQEWGHAWAPDGRKLAFVTGLHPPTIFIMIDGSEPRALTRTAGYSGSPAWSPDSRMIAFVGPGDGGLGIYVTNADGSGQRRLLARDVRGNFAFLSWSPDGRRIAFVDRRDRNLDIYVVNADGSGQRRLTDNVGRDTNPVWSPDSRRIAFESNWQVWLMGADGSGKRRLTRNGGRNFAPAWSPDGERIAFERRLGRRQSVPWCGGCGTAEHFEVWVMNADGSGARLLARDAAQQPSWSPNGRKIAFKKHTGEIPPKGERQSDIYVINADGTGQRNLTRGADRESQPVWSPAQR
jgi:TolB protein